MTERCESCGDERDDLITVQRVYVLFDEAHQPAGQRLADEFERWCPICRLSYPHQEVDEG